jgi:hypothetical protein
VRSLFLPRRAVESAERATEGFAEQLISTGALGGYSFDPIDGDVGYVRAGGPAGREVPIWTQEKARAYSVAGYRSNPMARAIIDTYVSFCVGDSGVVLQCAAPEVMQIATEFWTDPKVRLGDLQPAFCRDHLLMGETVVETMVGPSSGSTRLSIVDPQRITDVELEAGNPLWPARLHIRQADGDSKPLDLATVDDFTGLRRGDGLFWPSWKALLTDRRGTPFLSPILDDLENYDTVLSNLIDRTAIMRYIGLDVTLKGPNVDQKAIDEYIRARGGTHIPHSGTMEIHNESVEIKPFNGMTGALEDIEVDKAVLTNIAGGAGLSKPWLADPVDANRATSLTMAEPVRRRVGSVQNIWIGYQTELVRYAVDQAVAARRIPAMVTIKQKDGTELEVPASSTVTVRGPEIAAQNAEINSLMLFNLAQGIEKLVAVGAMSLPAARLASQKAWEAFVGIPYLPELDNPDGSKIDDLSSHIESTPGAGLRLA